MNRVVTLAVVFGMSFGTSGLLSAQEKADQAKPVLRTIKLIDKKEAPGDEANSAPVESIRVLGKDGAFNAAAAPGVFGGAGFAAGGPGIAFMPDGAGNFIWRATSPVKMEKVAFLGLNASHAPAVLRAQLKLKAGLVVDSVAPKGPADAAGIKPFDVLERLDDQWLINSAQLAALVRMYQSGDTITLTIIREGERQKVKAKLDEREMPALADEPPMGLPGGTMLGDPRETAVWMEKGPDGPVVRAAKTLRLGSGAPDSDAAYEDNGIVVRLSRNYGHTVLIANDKTGKILFKGPIDTDSDREKVPDLVRDRVKQLEKARAEVERAELQRAEEQERLVREQLKQVEQKLNEKTIGKTEQDNQGSSEPAKR